MGLSEYLVNFPMNRKYVGFETEVCEPARPAGDQWSTIAAAAAADPLLNIYKVTQLTRSMVRIATGINAGLLGQSHSMLCSFMLDEIILAGMNR